MQAAGYFDHARPEVLTLVPQAARRILDVGCGVGALGAALKQRQECKVVGLELDGEAVTAAREVLDIAIHGDAEEFAIPDLRQKFDCAVCADVLEHLRNPQDVLRKITDALDEDGTLVVSIPNARHWTIIARLLDGNFGYEDAGLLDRTHLRFFTRREAEMLLWRAGFDLPQVQAVVDPAYAKWEERGRPRQVTAGGHSFTVATPADAEELFVYQWLLTAKRRAQQPPVSIIIPVWNQLPYTQECLATLAQTTDPARTQIIVVDNGSEDGTGEWLEGWRGDGRVVCRFGENRGFAAACNEGLRQATGDVQILLNNDTHLTPGWLERLCETLLRDEQAGAAGPVSNYVSGPQQVATNCQRPDQVDGFAWEWMKANAGTAVETGRLIGFCLALRKEAVEKIGLLDERFGIGTYEDDDYCRRLQQAGYKLLIAPGSFVWHYGNRTFAGNGLSMEAIQAENGKLFAEKWEASK